MKKILMFIWALALSVPGLAQSDDGEEEITVSKTKSNAFFLGLKGGITLSSMTQPKEGKLYDASGIGFSGGLVAKVRFGKASENSAGGTGYLAAGFELKYKQNTVKTLAKDESGKDKANLSIGYFDVPIFVQVFPFAKTPSVNSLYIEVGAAIDGTLSRSPKKLILSNPKENMSEVVYNIDSNGTKLKGGDVRPFAGIGYTIPNTGLDINARYYIGTSELAKNMNCKLNHLEVSLAWLFNVGKF